jgi:hypothetical protein
MPRMTSRKLWAAAVGALLLVATGVVAWRTGWAPSRVPGPPPHLEALHAAAMNQLCSGRTPAGVGLKGEYFAAEGWRGAPTVARVDGTVDFDAALQWPAGKSAERPRSMRWTGWIKAPVTGVYRFHGSRPEMTIRVGPELLAGGGAAANAQFSMTAGRFYPIAVEIERFDAADPRPVRLEWTAPHGARYVPQRALLYQPTETVTPVRQ